MRLRGIGAFAVVQVGIGVKLGLLSQLALFTGKQALEAPGLHLKGHEDVALLVSIEPAHDASADAL